MSKHTKHAKCSIKIPALKCSSWLKLSAVVFLVEIWMKLFPSCETSFLTTTSHPQSCPTKTLELAILGILPHWEHTLKTNRLEDYQYICDDVNIYIYVCLYQLCRAVVHGLPHWSLYWSPLGWHCIMLITYARIVLAGKKIPFLQVDIIVNDYRPHFACPIKWWYMDSIDNFPLWSQLLFSMEIGKVISFLSSPTITYYG